MIRSQYRSTLLAVQGRLRWSENLTTCLLYISVVIRSVYPAGSTRWGQVHRKPNMFIVLSVDVQSKCTMMAVQGGGKWSENLTTCFWHVILPHRVGDGIYEMSRPIRISYHKKASKRKPLKERGYPIKDPHLVDYLQGF